MTNSLVRFCFGAAAATIVCAFHAAAQTTTARVSGTVTDASGAAIPNAVILLHNEATNIDRTAVAGQNGDFTAFSLPPAAYQLIAKAPGFATVQLKDLNLQIGQEFVWKPILAAEGVSSTVTVSADDISLLDTSSARIGEVVPSREIKELPINGRQISQLYLLTPGATNTGTGNFDNIHFSGRAVEQNILRLDGIEATSIIDTSPGNLNGELTSTFRLQQSLEAVQEFRIDSSSYPAEMGTGTGGQISFLTKSGSDTLHGSAFEYLRNDFFDARNFFNRKNTPANDTKFRLNQFGGSLGGAPIPGKFFLFGTYEGLRQIYVTPYTAATISNYAKSMVPTTSPIYPILAAYPNDPNSAASESAAGTLSTSVTVVAPNSIREDFGMLRADYHISDRFQVYARYNRDQGVSLQTQDASRSQFGQVEVPQNGVFAFNQAWTSRLFNETKFGFNGIKMRVQGISGPSPSADLSRARIAVAGLTNVGALISLSSSFNGVGAPYTGGTLNYIDNLSIVRGSHSMKFGGEVRPIYLYNDQVGGTTYTYNSIAQLVNNTPNQIQFYGNLSDLSPFTGLSGNAKVKQAYYIGFAQDEWKASPNLTVSYGLRYEYYSVLHEVRNKDVVFNMANGTITPGGQNWYNSSVKNFGPRLGITYAPPSLNNKTVIRAGAGLFFGPGQTEDQIQPEANDRVTKTFSAGQAVYPINPQTDVYSTYNINSPTLGYQPRAYAPNYTIPERVGTYTASIEQQLPGSLQLMVAYVGSRGRNLFLRSITNLITGVYQNPTTGAGTAIRQFTVGGVPTSPGVPGAPGTNRFAEIDYKTSGGHDTYNALQTTLQRRLGSGLSLGAQYTYAKELGTSSGSNEATTAQNPYNFDMEFGRGTNDIRHSFNATVLYALPFGHNRHFQLNGIADELAGGWQIGGIVNARAGLPIDVLITRADLAYVGNANTPYAGQVYSAPFCLNAGAVVTNCATGTLATTAVDNVPGGGNTRNIRRPNRLPGVNPFSRQVVSFSPTSSYYQYLNPAAFTTPAPGTFGNYQRNTLSGPTLTQLDLTLVKNFRIFERFSGEFKADAYNILNHPNFANPGTVRLAQSIPASPLATANTVQPNQPFTTVSGGNLWGGYNSTVGNQVGLGTNRQLQLSFRLQF